MIQFENNAAVVKGSQGAATVFFSNSNYDPYRKVSKNNSGKKKENQATSTALDDLNTNLKLVPWGEDNLFPQRIASQLEYCGVASSALDFKAKAIFGQGLFVGRVTGYKDDGTEIFEISKPGEDKEVKDWMRNNRGLTRYFIEFLKDWVTYGNCFPELIATKDKKKIAKIVHQESCDVRYKQMEKGVIKSVYLSKIWGDPNDQYVRYDKTQSVMGVRAIAKVGDKVDNEYVKELRSIDMYNPLDSARQLLEKETNIILPVNYPSVNKTYYQSAYWDGARLSGWLEIASKIPAVLKALYTNAFNIKYHIEVPEQYFEKRVGAQTWNELSATEKQDHKRAFLQQCKQFLSGADNSHSAFVSYFDIDHQGNDVGRIKITVIDNKSNIDKDLVASVAANSEILFAAQINPDLIGAGAPGGPYSGSSGSGSNIREAYLVYVNQLKPERQLVLEPLYLIRDINGWDPELEFRFRDVVLTTLDAGKGTVKKLS